MSARARGAPPPPQKRGNAAASELYEYSTHCRPRVGVEAQRLLPWIDIKAELLDFLASHAPQVVSAASRQDIEGVLVAGITQRQDEQAVRLPDMPPACSALPASLRVLPREGAAHIFVGRNRPDLVPIPRGWRREGIDTTDTMTLVSFRIPLVIPPGTPREPGGFVTVPLGGTVLVPDPTAVANHLDAIRRWVRIWEGPQPTGYADAFVRRRTALQVWEYQGQEGHHEAVTLALNGVVYARTWQDGVPAPVKCLNLIIRGYASPWN